MLLMSPGSISLALAKFLHLSKPQFSQVFKKYDRGVSLTLYRVVKRMQNDDS